MLGIFEIVKNWASREGRPAPHPAKPPSGRQAMGVDPFEAGTWKSTELVPKVGAINPPWTPGVELTDAELESLFFQRLLEPPAGHAADLKSPVVWEQRLIRCAQEAQRASQRLPRVPTVIPALLRMLRDESAGVAELAQLIEQDLVILVELLGEVNVAANGLPHKITQAHDAIVLLGRQRLRMLIARVAFRPVLSTDKGWLTQRAAARMQVQFELSSHACHLMVASQDTDVDESELVLAGLTQHAGWMLLFYLLDSQDEITSLPHSGVFWQHLSAAACNTAQRIAEQWGFPVRVVYALGELARGESKLTPLAEMVRRVDRIVKLRILADHQEWVSPSARGRTLWPIAEQRCFDEIKPELRETGQS